MNTNKRRTPDYAAMLLIDHQEGFFPGIRSIDPTELRHNVIALGELAKALAMPTVLTASFPSGISGPVIPKLVRLFPEVPILDRTLSIRGTTLNSSRWSKQRDAVSSSCLRRRPMSVSYPRRFRPFAPDTKSMPCWTLRGPGASDPRALASCV